VTVLEQAIAAGDLSQAQALYVPARAAYQRLAPAAQRLAELDNGINARADYFEKREQDPAFTGFHRIEYTLFQQRNLDGLAPVAERLLSDVTILKQQLLAQSLPPEQMVNIVVRNLNSIADVRASSGEEERYSHSDLNGFAGNLDAARKVVDLLRPLLAKSAAELLPNIDNALNAFDTELNGFKVGDGYASYDSVSAEQRKQIADKAKALADALDGIDPALGLSGL
jgi:iron uptake system component EfeO